MESAEIKPNVKQQSKIEGHSYRMFIIEHENGNQQLITIFHDSHLAQLYFREDHQSSWPAPIWLQEVWD